MRADALILHKIKWKDKVFEGDKEKESKLTVDYLLENTLWREIFTILGCLSNLPPAEIHTTSERLSSRCVIFISITLYRKDVQNVQVCFYVGKLYFSYDSYSHDSFIFMFFTQFIWYNVFLTNDSFIFTISFYMINYFM